jgi:hypothetical protein
MPTAWRGHVLLQFACSRKRHERGTRRRSAAAAQNRKEDAAPSEKELRPFLNSDLPRGLESRWVAGITISGPVQDRAGSGYCCTRTWKPAALRAFTSSAPSKLPVTVSVSVWGFAVSAVTPSTFLIALSMALLQEPQQL